MAELTEVDVEAMVRDARAGDAAALGQLYDTYRDRVARFATGRLGDAEKAEDVTSETFEAVCRNLGSYRAGTDFEAWLFTIAHRRVADHFRRRFRRREVELDEAVHSAHRGGRDAVPVSLPAVDGPEEPRLMRTFSAAATRGSATCHTPASPGPCHSRPVPSVW